MSRVLEIFRECESASLTLPPSSLAQALAALAAAGDTEVPAVGAATTAAGGERGASTGTVSVPTAGDEGCSAAGITAASTAIAAAASGDAASTSRGSDQGAGIGDHAMDIVDRGERFLLQEAERIFKQARAGLRCREGGSTATGERDWNSQGESIYTLMVRLASRAGELPAAMEYLREMRKPPVNIKPKLRTFVPILEACAAKGLSDEAESLYGDDLLKVCAPKEATAVWSSLSEEEDRLWQYVFALRLRAWSNAVTRSGISVGGRDAHSSDGETLRNRFLLVLENIRAVCPQLRADSGVTDALQEAFTVLGWKVGCAKIGPDGRCPISSTVLQAVRPCEAELNSILGLIERLAIEHASQRKLESWAGFKVWLEDSGSEWDTVIDGANVGHCNQNRERGAFSHRQIDALIEQCTLSGRRRVAVVLREHWLRPDTDFNLPQFRTRIRRLPQLDPGGGPPEAEGGLKAAESALRDAKLPDAAEHAELSGDDSDKGSAGGLPQELTEEQSRVADIVQKWRKQGVLIVSPACINDDWVALYIAVAMCLRGVQDVQFVTNDELRDHFWRMRQPVAFQTWRERHITRYQILLGAPPGPASDDDDEEGREHQVQSVQLFPPPLYSHRVQHSADNKCWHFPVRRPTEASAEGGYCWEAVAGDPVSQARLGWLVACDAGNG